MEKRQNTERRTSAYSPVRARQIARRRRQRIRRRRRMMAAFVAVVLLAGGGACGARQAWLRGQRQEYAEQGLAYLESQDYAQAVTAFDDAIALAHGRIGAFESQMLLYRAEAQYRSGDYQSALASYETLYAKDESNEACKTGLSLCLLETGDYDRAKSLGVILGQVYSRIARDQINAGQYDEALSTIDTGLAEAGADDVGREELTFNQAVAWEYKGDYKKALEILESYDQKYTAEGNAARELAFLKTRQGNHEEKYMAELFDMKELEERVILIAVSTDDEDDTRASLDELEELVKTAGGITADKMIQNRERIHPGTYLGKGKIDEVRERIWELQATGVVCDDELSPAQLRNLEDALDTKVMDRTMVILDIFASRATTSEGKIQVELAQLKYRAARLVGLRSSLSRLGGGIGTRGPGEKKLEMDRRLIHERIGQLKSELEEVKRHRDVIRKQREKAHTPVAAIVGYTNAGKSTLLNRLTDAGILAEDKLFATLDPTTRNLELESGQQIMLTDTVGFIRKLPHHLIEAFKSTLEEAKYSDIILHVVDCSNPNMDMQMHVVYETLRELKVEDKIIVTVFNKIDQKEDGEFPRDLQSDYQVQISAKTGAGLPELLDTLEQILRSQKVYLERVFSYQEAGKIQTIRKYGELLSEEYQADGIAVKAYVPAELFGSLIVTDH